MRTEERQAYLHENKRQLDIYLQGDHGKEIHRAFRDDSANHRRKPENGHIVVSGPSDDKECEYV